MSDTKVLADLKEQLAHFITQRDQAQVNFQQLIGAIFALESMIKKIEDGESNGEVNSESQGCVA